ncbi:hypothetical protein A3J43_00650 [Candidatus Uhrbacteria bacterium RIFCSPHIGHO2_12_FULL_54_23]|uniref:Sodium/calcium exchanger membrane region domain-containing protein n=3 Tax=Candidatus Uhriibacteriota TaxID=1752732 RepID=A0A1F7UJL1_9BACT|nr:MAG: hypothetical protein A3J43_00650 [Candidatus Uhrbacteria bacterium RIFCSPHIGHO2_12_FULL_54_23]OGL83681.1 MAG: hypothetical protein A3B36_01055 [Candidatus Uhrbacteria bacterium RIFCSPLOWO2_01_FULL_55_36]OGL90410.1 MAG: hypothetical protein A3J36_00510 [Candidatus Uhrbacteria bacterium RIFCSPLOWO2_02_FULL_54_37]
MNVLFHLLIIAVSILLIGKGSDWLTDSLIPLGRKLKVTSVSVGLIFVSIAVSLPEVLVALATINKGYPTITLGVIIGSIFANIGLMTGLAALVRPLKVGLNVILRDGVFSLVVPVLVFAVSLGGEITRAEGFAFILLFVTYVINVFLQEKMRSREEQEKEMKEIEIEFELLGFDFAKFFKPGIISFLAGALILITGAQLFSNELIFAAQQFQISQLVIGLTLGAIGPSIPNIAAAYKAAKRGMGEIAVSETFGSNIFTLLVTLGMAAMLSPLTVSATWLRFDLPALIGMSALLFLFTVTRKSISRAEGGMLLAAYLIVLAIQIMKGV